MFHKRKVSIFTFIFVLFTINMGTYLLPRFDQFNLFYKYDATHSLIDWNLLHIVSENIDADGKKDTIMYTGCVFLTIVSASTIPKDSQCKNNVVENGEMVGRQLPISRKKLINSYVGRKGNSWDIVTHYLGETKLYTITAGGDIVEENVPVALKVDSFLYTITHLYTLVI